MALQVSGQFGFCYTGLTNFLQFGAAVVPIGVLRMSPSIPLLIQLSDLDNVGVARSPLAPGQRVV